MSNFNNGNQNGKPYRPEGPILLTPDNAHSREAYIDFVGSIIQIPGMEDKGYLVVVHPDDETADFAAKAYPDRVTGPFATRKEAERNAELRVRQVHEAIQKDVAGRTKKYEKPVSGSGPKKGE